MLERPDRHLPQQHHVGGRTQLRSSGDTCTDNVFISSDSCGSNARRCTPRFVGATSSRTQAGNFHFAPEDTSANGAADQRAHPATDIDGQARPQGSTVDAGVDEIK
jgi:hypothetical protein